MTRPRRLPGWEHDPMTGTEVHVRPLEVIDAPGRYGWTALLSLPERGIPTRGDARDDSEPSKFWDGDLNWAGYERIAEWVFDPGQGWHTEVIGS